MTGRNANTADPIDALVRLAYLEGFVTTHGLYEQAVRRRKYGARVEPLPGLLEKLETALKSAREDPTAWATVGALLRAYRHRRGLNGNAVAARLGVSRTLHVLMENDRISPVRISIDVWLALGKMFRLSQNDLVAIIRRTHQLVVFRPSMRVALARCDDKRGKRTRAELLRSAEEELYARAQLVLSEEEQSRINALIDELTRIRG